VFGATGATGPAATAEGLLGFGPSAG
jgi:hypothetical protein